MDSWDALLSDTTDEHTLRSLCFLVGLRPKRHVCMDHSNRTNVSIEALLQTQRNPCESGRLHQCLHHRIIQDHVTDCRAAAAPPTQVERARQVVVISRYAHNSATQISVVEKWSETITLEPWPGYGKRVRLRAVLSWRHALEQQR